MTDGPAQSPALMSVAEILAHAEAEAAAATRFAEVAGALDDSQAAVVAYGVGVLNASRAGAHAQASQAWTALAVARMRGGHKLPAEPAGDPRDRVRERVGGQLPASLRRS